MPMNESEYYKAPSQEIFDDIKQASISVWKTYDDTFKYATGKIDRIKDLKNVRDNYAYMVAMFDRNNQFALLKNLHRDDSRLLVERLIN